MVTRSTLVVPIEDPHFYLEDPWPTFARMQDEEPFYHYAPLDTFVVTRHADIGAITSKPGIFVSSKGLFLNDVKYRPQAGERTLTGSFFPKDGEQVGTADQPRHSELRRVIAPAFAPSAMARLRDSLTSYVRELIDEVWPLSCSTRCSTASLPWNSPASPLPSYTSSATAGRAYRSSSLRELGAFDRIILALTER